VKASEGTDDVVLPPARPGRAFGKRAPTPLLSLMIDRSAEGSSVEHGNHHIDIAEVCVGGYSLPMITPRT
jgi:hypothetical protein